MDRISNIIKKEYIFFLDERLLKLRNALSLIFEVSNYVSECIPIPEMGSNLSPQDWSMAVMLSPKLTSSMSDTDCISTSVSTD